MLEYLKKEANMTLTENGAATLSTSGSDCLDLFASIGAIRRQSDDEMIRRFLRAYTEDPDLAMKILFFARDIRGGLGERRVFRVIFRWLADNHGGSVKKNIANVAEYGRYDDLLCLLDTSCEAESISALKDRFESDRRNLACGGEVSLLGKWLPSINASCAKTVKQGRKVARAFGLTEQEYRKSLTALRAKIRIIENDLRVKDYTFDYSGQPSRAMLKYRKAFLRNDKERYEDFLKKVSAGEVRLHAGGIYPYEIVRQYLRMDYIRRVPEEERNALNATWEALPDFGGDEDMLAVIDNSGSMYRQSDPLPASVALSLGLYFAERNKGAFRNHFITFSERPQLIGLKGDTFADRLAYAASFSEVANTDLEAVFDLILRAAVENRVPEKDLPAKLVIISDMEFDRCVENSSLTNFGNARAKYAAQGYRLPEIVFWNVASRNRQQPVTMNEQGVALVSGASPRLFSMIAGGVTSPYAFMMQVLDGERYKAISA